MIYTDTRVVKTCLNALNKQIPLLIEVGGTNSGKTFGIMISLILYCLTQTSYKLVTVVAVNFPYIRRDTLRCFLEIVNELGVIIENKSKTTSTYQIGHCVIEFIGMEDPGKASHGKRDVLYINEAWLIPYMVYKNLSIRTDQTTILDYNPHEDFWLQEIVIPKLEPGSYRFIRTTYNDNPAVSDKVKKDIEALQFENPNLYKILGLGISGAVEGLVFPNITLVDSFPKECKRIGYGLDFGYSNDPTTLVKMGFHLGEIYLDEYIYETGMGNDDIVMALFESAITEHDLIVADSADPKSIAEIRKKGFNIQPAAKGPDSVRFSIDLLNQFKINVVKRSTNIIKERKNYRYTVNRLTGKTTNVPIDMFNHTWDAAMYIGVRLLTPKRTFQRKIISIR
jgi:phage terminase large subunit